MTQRTPHDVTPAEAVPTVRDDGPGLLTLDGIGVRLGGRQVLSDVTFSLRKGDFAGIIGPNGAGKTTLLRVILGLLQPSGGRFSSTASRTSGAKRSIGYVPQKLVIDPDMPLRARDVVSLGLDGYRLGFSFPSRQRRELVDAALADVGADGYADAPGRRVVRRRAAARADRARADLPAEAAPARRAAGQPRPAQRAGDRHRARQAGPRARDLGAPFRARHEPAAARDGPDRVRRERPRRHRAPTRWSPRRASAGCTATTWTWSACTAGSWWWRASTDALPLRAGAVGSGPVRTALLVGAVVAVTSGVIGVFTVLRGQSFAGHSLADVATTGGSGAFLIGINQFWGFLVAGVAAAAVMEAHRRPAAQGT